MKKFVLPVILALIVASCGKQTTEPGGGGSVSISNPLPLSVGNQWMYINFERGSKPDTTRDTTRIVGTQVVNGHDAYVAVSTDEGDIDTSYVYRDGDYIYIYDENGMQGSTLMKFLKVPLNTGDSWVVYTESDTLYTLTITARILGSSSITVPAGSFESSAEMEMRSITTYSWNNATYAETTYTYYYIVDNIGIAKVRDIYQGIEDISELEDYDLR